MALFIMTLSIIIHSMMVARIKKLSTMTVRRMMASTKTLSIRAHRLQTFSIIALSIMALSIKAHEDLLSI
jgi:hypothetical protein